MWQWVNANTAGVQAISEIAVVLLTFVLVTATLRYVRLTKDIAKAAGAQAEAAQKPILTLKRDDETKPTDLADMTDLVSDSIRQQLRIHVGSVLEIINIGTGPPCM